MTAVNSNPRLARQRTGGWGALGEEKLVVLHRDLDRIAVVEVALQDLFRERVLEETLDGPAHRTRAVSRVVTLLDQEVLRFLVENKLQFPTFKALHNLDHFQIQNLDKVRLGKRT